MTEGYRICYQGGEGEIVEKKSRFIATVRPVKTEEEAMKFVEEMRRKYWDARHNCYAYVCGEKNEQMKCSDDGEPSQTAGRPMLDVLLGENLHNVCVVVTRYFGGTLLGTGGLVRAYSQAVKEGLFNCRLMELHLGRKLMLKTEYTAVGKIQYLAGQMGMTILETQYSDKVMFILLVPDEQAEAVKNKLTEATNGKAQMEYSDPFYFGEDGKDKVIF